MYYSLKFASIWGWSWIKKLNSSELVCEFILAHWLNPPGDWVACRVVVSSKIIEFLDSSGSNGVKVSMSVYSKIYSAPLDSYVNMEIAAIQIAFLNIFNLNNI